MDAPTWHDQGKVWFLGAALICLVSAAVELATGETRIAALCAVIAGLSIFTYYTLWENDRLRFRLWLRDGDDDLPFNVIDNTGSGRIA